MAKSRGFVSMDHLMAENIVTLGFFINVHPDYHNRTLFKTVIEEMLKVNGVKEKINIYPRKMWAMHKNVRTTTRALVVEVATSHREIVTDVLISKTSKYYENAEYIPLSRIGDDYYTKTMQNIFVEQNKYLHKMNKKAIYGIAHAQRSYFTKGEESLYSFQYWIENMTWEGQKFIHACEIGQGNSVHIIYHKNLKR